jgi:hypothetical protein
MYEDETTRWLRQYIRDLYYARHNPYYPRRNCREFMSCAIEELRRRRHVRAARRIYA